MALSTLETGENAEPHWIVRREILVYSKEVTCGTSRSVMKTFVLIIMSLLNSEATERSKTPPRLSSFLSSLDAKVPACEAKLTEIAKLPNEILQHIFLEACDVVDDCGPERLSQVCQRFRNIATSFPKLWTAAHSNMDLLTLKRRLELSIDLPLSISLIPSGGRYYDDSDSDDLSDRHGSTWDEFLKLTTPHCYRWRSLYIDSGDDGENIFTFLEYPGCIVPSVESLTIICPRCEGNEIFYVRIHEKWEFPNLTTLRAKFFIPHSGWFNSMTEYTFNLRSDIPVPKRTQSINFQTFVTFSISNNNSKGFIDPINEDIEQIIGVIDIPNVEEMVITIYYTNNTFSDPLARLVFSLTSFPSIKRLSHTFAHSPVHLELLKFCLSKLRTVFFHWGAKPIKCSPNIHLFVSGTIKI